MYFCDLSPPSGNLVRDTDITLWHLFINCYLDSKAVGKAACLLLNQKAETGRRTPSLTCFTFLIQKLPPYITLFYFTFNSLLSSLPPPSALTPSPHPHHPSKQYQLQAKRHSPLPLFHTFPFIKNQTP